MLTLRRSDPEPSVSDIIKSYKTTLLWSSDGWVYDVKNKSRRMFFSTPDRDIFKMIEQTGIFCITDVLHQEDTEIILFSGSSKHWREGNDVFRVIDEDC
jgi:hypothetical protein